MHNNSLIKLLRSFSQKEISDFNDFLLSPYFNKKNSVVKLFEIISPCYPEFTDETLLKKNIHAKLFPGKPYNDSNLRVLVHNLSELAKKFISYNDFGNNKIEFDFGILYGLIQKQQFSNMDKMINKLRSDLVPENIMAESYNFFRYRLEYENISFLAQTHIGVFEKFLDKADFENVFHYLSSFYYIKSMRLYINILNLQHIYKKEFNTHNFEKMISVIDKSMFDENPVTEIYYCIIKLFEKDNDEKYYFRIKELVKQIKNTLHRNDLNEMYINLTNYCNRKINDGIKKFEKEKFEIYKEENELKLYLINGYMPSIYYKNLVILALSLNEYSWVKEFILTHKNDLPGDSRENIYNYCMALFEFDMKQFEKSLEMLSKIKFDELYLKYDSKILQLMIYYETNASESLISSLEAYRHFLSNNKLLPEIKKELYSNFYKYFSKLVTYKSKNDLLELERLKLNIPADMKMFNKEWIIRKIEELTG